MTAIGRAKISTRLFVGFGAVLILMAALAAIAIQQVSTINGNLTKVNDVNSVKQRYAINFRGSVHDRAIRIRDVTLVTDAGELQQTLDDIDRLAAFYAKSALLMVAMFTDRTDISTEERAILSSIQETEKKTLPLVSEVIEAQKAGDSTKAKAILMRDARPAFIEWLARINQMIDLEENMNQVIGHETRQIAQNFPLLMFAIGFVSLLIGAAFGTWNVLTIRPLQKITALMLRLSDGDISVELPKAKGGDEVSEIIGAVEVFKERMTRNKALEDQTEQSRLDGAVQRKRMMHDLANRFEGAVGGIVETVSSAATTMQLTAQRLSAAAQLTSAQAVSVSGAAEEAGANVTSMASSAEQLGASVKEIGRQVSHSSEQARQAVSEAEQTAIIVNELSEAATRIDGIVAMISSIAGQTNLLALNATIEAARAGESGRGFAVVAAEVKGLAQQTATATSEISQQIANIQSTTDRSVKAIASITGTIRAINDTSSSISSAVDEQGEATREIVHALAQASAGTTEVTSNIAGVAKAAEEAGEGAAQVLAASSDLARQSEMLRNEVQIFLESVRAA